MPDLKREGKGGVSPRGQPICLCNFKHLPKVIQTLFTKSLPPHRLAYDLDAALCRSL